MRLAKAFRDKNVYGVAYQFLAPIAEQLFRFRVHQRDFSVGIGDEDRFWRGFEQDAELIFRLPAQEQLLLHPVIALPQLHRALPQLRRALPQVMDVQQHHNRAVYLALCRNVGTNLQRIPAPLAVLDLELLRPDRLHHFGDHLVQIENVQAEADVRKWTPNIRRNQI